MTHSERLAVGGSVTVQPYRPTRHDAALAFLYGFIGLGLCACAYLAMPRW